MHSRIESLMLQSACGLPKWEWFGCGGGRAGGRSQTIKFDVTVCRRIKSHREGKGVFGKLSSESWAYFWSAILNFKKKVLADLKLKIGCQLGLFPPNVIVQCKQGKQFSPVIWDANRCVSWETKNLVIFHFLFLITYFGADTKVLHAFGRNVKITSAASTLKRKK